jgi:hypothetical protein
MFTFNRICMSPNQDTTGYRRTDYLNASQQLYLSPLDNICVSTLTRIDRQQHLFSHLIITLLALSLATYATLSLSTYERLVILNPAGCHCWMLSLLSFSCGQGCTFPSGFSACSLRNLKLSLKAVAPFNATPRFHGRIVHLWIIRTYRKRMAWSCPLSAQHSQLFKWNLPFG